MILNGRQALLQTPSELIIDQTIRFSLGEAIMVPKKGGIYFLHDFRGVLYVGKSENLSRRFNQHLLDCQNPLITEAIRTSIGPVKFSWMLLDLEMQTRLEKRFIRFFLPPCNRILMKQYEE